MAKVRNPTTRSQHFKVDPAALTALNVTDVTLAVDTRLFLDPMLLGSSSNRNFATTADTQYRTFFTNVITLLAASTVPEDRPWREASKRLGFREIRGTCLGYGAGSINGSAWGPALVTKVVHAAKEIIDLGIRDPDLFALLGLLEGGVGPDRISDMTTNIVLDSLLHFNRDVIAALRLPVERFSINDHDSDLLRNPFHGAPILLTPRDVLRPLPTASDWDQVEAAARHNEHLRKRVNSYIGHLWSETSRRKAKDLRAQALTSREAFETLLDATRAADKRAYDSTDPEGLLNWSQTGARAATQNPLALTAPAPLSLAGVREIVREIVQQFRQLIEQNGLYKSLWHGRKPLPENIHKGYSSPSRTHTAS